MKRFKSSFWPLLGLGLLLLVGCSPRPTPEGGLQIVDGRGDTVRLAAPARRVVSLAPSCTELVAAVGGQGALVARTEFCDQPASVLFVPVTPGFDEPSVEQLLQLRPDLVLASAITTPPTVARLRGVGLPVLVLKGRSLDDIETDLARVAQAMGLEASAAQQEFASWRARVREVLPDFGVEPRLRGLLTFGPLTTYSAGRDTFAHDLLREVGVENIAASAAGPWPELSLEYLLAAQPDVLLVTQAEVGTVAPAPQALVERYRAHPIWQQLSAVREGRIMVLDDDLFTVPSPSLGPALWELAEALYPDAFRPYAEEP